MNAGEGQALALRYRGRFLFGNAEAFFFTVARGPVPRERSRTVVSTVARGPVPRDRWIARTISRPGGLSYRDIVRPQGRITTETDL